MLGSKRLCLKLEKISSHELAVRVLGAKFLIDQKSSQELCHEYNGCG